MVYCSTKVFFLYVLLDATSKVIVFDKYYQEYQFCIKPMAETPWRLLKLSEEEEWASPPIISRHDNSKLRDPVAQTVNFISIRRQ